MLDPIEILHQAFRQVTDGPAGRQKVEAAACLLNAISYLLTGSAVRYVVNSLTNPPRDRQTLRQWVFTETGEVRSPRDNEWVVGRGEVPYWTGTNYSYLPVSILRLEVREIEAPDAGA